MESLYAAVISICAKLQVVSDFFWEFPTNIEWYANIPIVGSFSLAIIVLLGTGIFFTFRFGFVQFRHFGRGLRTLVAINAKKTGISPLASFLLSSAMRVGPGNILGVTGAISIGGPGALFWMWFSALFSMATSFVESTLSQIFKERDGENYVGGMPYYGRKLAKGAAWVGVALSCLYIIYAFLCLPAQGFNTISGLNMIGTTISGSPIPTDSTFNLVAFILMMVFITVLTFGGIKKITKFTDMAVPIMAGIYLVTTFILIALHWYLLPWMFATIFAEAFVPNAIFGGAFGVALSQGIRRGLMSNEAGQGTISMPAAASNSLHPCEQGNVQSIGVFFDTIVICTPTAFVVILSQMWLGDQAAAWFDAGKLERFVMSCDTMIGNGVYESAVVTIIVSLCFGLFALTTLVGFLSFTEMCAKRISKTKGFIFVIRILCLLVITFGVLANAAGLDLSALWNLSDLANIMMVYVNIPLLYVGLKYVSRSYKHYCQFVKQTDVVNKFVSHKNLLEKYKDSQKNGRGGERIQRKIDKTQKKIDALVPQVKEIAQTSDIEAWNFTSEIAGISLPVWEDVKLENIQNIEKHIGVYKK